MIYTVTFNPALDYVVQVNDLQIGQVNRTESEDMFCGGKGINVSMVLNELEIESVALGFIAGFTGITIEKGMREHGVTSDFIQLPEGMTRINVKIKGHQETEINGQGPVITQKAIDQIFEKIDRMTDGDMLVLAGSIPSTLPDDIYEKIMERVAGKNIKVVVDATKDLLKNVLKYRPFLIKPNNYELGEMFGVELETEEDIIHYAKKLQEQGAVNVLISMAGDGAILIDESGTFIRIGVPKGKVLNSVGAGDSMVAGFIAGYSKTKDYRYALKLGTAAGSATAFSKGLATKETIETLLGQIS